LMSICTRFSTICDRS